MLTISQHQEILMNLVLPEPLDFGHWVAHKLEQISAFRIGHGEAVAVGLAVDLIYSKRVGIISKDDCDRILNPNSIDWI